MEKWSSFLRTLVRPVITWTGWFTFLTIAVVLILRFADKELATTVAVAFTGVIATLIGFWFGQRGVSK